MLTPHCSAASGIVVPPSIVSTTRLRKSAEYGFAIHAGLLPAGSLNHIRAAMGIPDSAFPGNALNYRMTGNLIPIAPCPKCGNRLILVVTPGSYQSLTFGCFNCNRPLSLRRDKAPDSPQPSK